MTLWARGRGLALARFHCSGRVVPERATTPLSGPPGLRERVRVRGDMLDAVKYTIKQTTTTMTRSWCVCICVSMRPSQIRHAIYPDDCKYVQEKDELEDEF
jgi:hypothetical protein